MFLQDWNPHETGAALQKWKKKLCKAFSAIGINEGKQPVSRMATLEEDPPKVPFPPTPKRLKRTPPTNHGANRDAFGTADASPYLQDSHMVTPRSTSPTRRIPLRLSKSTERLCSECSRAVREGWTRREGTRAAVPGDVL
ncbi:hypothetical protein PI125_g23049 [Phytophthora idaei]|nr:hypothetical protein PI125_g23049 [Phytophthora idaei]